MTVHRHEIITLTSAADPQSIRSALMEVPSDAYLTALEVSTPTLNGAGAVIIPGTAQLTFERKSDDD